MPLYYPDTNISKDTENWLANLNRQGKLEMSGSAAGVSDVGAEVNPASSGNFLSRLKNIFSNKQEGIPVGSTGSPPDEFSAYWKKPVIGKIPRDQFVQAAGTAASAISPNTWAGRLGGGLAGLGAQAYNERIRREYEEPNEAAKRRLMEAQAQYYESGGYYGGRQKSPSVGALVKPEYTKKEALKRVAEIDEKIGHYSKSKTIIDSETARMASLLGKNAPIGSTMEGDVIQQIIDSYMAEREAVFPYTKTEEEKEAFKETEKKKNYYKEFFEDMMKADLEKRIGVSKGQGELAIQEQLIPEPIKPEKPNWLKTKLKKSMEGQGIGIERNVSMPDAAANKGRIIRDTDSGKRYISDGINWTEVQ